MSEPEGDKTTAGVPADTAQSAGPAPADSSRLADLMATASDAPASKARDLEGEALRAAEHALAEGHRALAAARAHLGVEPGAPTPDVRRTRVRERVLRALLVINVMVMLAVVSLPVPEAAKPTPPVAAPAPANTPATTAPPATPDWRDPWNRAMAAADRRDFAGAITILEQYLSPRMAPSEQLSVLMALAHYSARLGRIDAAQEYQRRADAIEGSHSLPEDLVAEAQAAAASGDQESLRRIWARFLLQQRQVPSWLHKHVAEAYLQLGDSYRIEANTAAEAARLAEIERTAELLRARALEKEGGK